MRYHSYINTTKKILKGYTGQEPLAIFLKNFFASNKKHGSKDRKHIAGLCYAYLRLGKAAGEISDINILMGLFFSEQSYHEILEFFKPLWNDKIGMPLEEKIAFLNFSVNDIFPFKNELTAAVSHEKYCESFLKQPKLFLRIRPGKNKTVLQKLQKAKIPLALIDEECIALSNATKLDDIIEADREVVIQDYNSQQVFNFLKKIKLDKTPTTVWDCCAASGGKSILLFDVLKRNVQLTVSDIRISILLNLHQRFNKAGINKDYNYFVCDLSTPDFKFPEVNSNGKLKLKDIDKYQVIVCDAPCTGSGTWSRTPENLHYFTPEHIDAFTQKQKKIVANVIPHLQKDGLFFYITCSVFKKENEDIVQFIKEQFQLQVLHMELLKGYDKKADSMFVAVFSN
jgi:16S rRNA (cytosine967-C5)-methyltransferase